MKNPCNRLILQYFNTTENPKEPKIPDVKTIWLFKERLGKNGLTEKLFDLFTESLNAKGIIAKEGSMVDA